MIIKANSHSFAKSWSRDASIQFIWGCYESKLFDANWLNSCIFTSTYGWSTSFNFGICSSRNWNKNI